MRPSRTWALLAVVAGLTTAFSGCAIPKAIGKTAGGIVKGAGQVVSGTAKAVTAPLR